MLFIIASCFFHCFTTQVEIVENDSVHSRLISFGIKVHFFEECCVFLMFLKVKFASLPCHFLNLSIINEKN